MAKSRSSNTPGKTRTWWHPLLVNVLRWLLDEHYRVDDEVNVGKNPLRIDVLLVRLLGGELPDDVRRKLAGLAEDFNEYTLLEYKSPTDTLRAGHYQTLLSYALLWRAQTHPLLAGEKLNLIVVAPRLTKPYRRELALCGVTPREQEPGIWRFEGELPLFTIWFLETDRLADRHHPVLSVFSKRLVREMREVSRELSSQGDGELFAYVAQPIGRFQRLGEAFAMRHRLTETEMRQLWEEIARSLDPQTRDLVLRELPPEERLRGLSAQERTSGLSAQELISSLSAQGRRELLRLLQEDTPEPKRGKKS